MIAISAACYLPATSVAVADLPELAALTDAERATCAALGIDQVPADDMLSATELAARAAQRALAAAGLEAADVDALILVEPRAPDTLISSEATRLQAALGAGRAMTFAAGGLGCASVTPALLAARGLLAADPDLAHVLVAHGSKPAAPHRYRHPVTVSGDCGGALVVSRQGPVRIRDIVLESSGTYADLFCVPYRDRPQAQWREICTDLPGYSFRLAVETRKRLGALTARLLERNGLTAADITCYLSQNLSAAAFRSYADALGAPIARPCLDNLARLGHLGANDVVVNLLSVLDSGDLGPGGRAVALNVSPAAAWSALLIEAGPVSRDGQL